MIHRIENYVLKKGKKCKTHFVFLQRKPRLQSNLLKCMFGIEHLSTNELYLPIINIIAILMPIRIAPVA